MKFYFAPLEGITGYVYRNAFEKCFKNTVDVYMTPFIAPGNKRCLNPKEQRDVMPQNNQQVHIIPQILTNNAEAFIKTAKELNALGYQEVNLNLGCPSGTVVAKGKGAGFLEDPQKLEKFLDEIFSVCDCQISIKTRLGMTYDWEWEDLIKIYNKFPFSEVIVHPRVREDYYKNKPNLERFQEAVDCCRHSLCYNGDIFRVEEYRVFTKKFPTIDKIMIGRGLLRNPSLVRQIRGGECFSKEEGWMFHQMLLDGYGEVMSGDKNVLFKMKELWSYWAYSFTNTEKYIKKIRKANKMCEYKDVITQLFREEEITV